MHYIEPGNPKKALFVLRTNEQIEMLRESKSRSSFIRVIQRVPSFQNGTISILFERSSFSTLDLVVATPTCTSNTANDFGKTPRKPTKTTRTTSGNELPQNYERLEEFLEKTDDVRLGEDGKSMKMFAWRQKSKTR